MSSPTIFEYGGLNLTVASERLDTLRRASWTPQDGEIGQQKMKFDIVVTLGSAHQKM
jgi:hypothetical protein